MSAFTQEQIAIKLHNSIKNAAPRGGAAVAEVQGSVLMFGGADREQVHYQDLIGYERCRKDGKASYFDKLNVEGDVPMPRSGHSMVSYGRFAFVFGGIDFAEEIAYNDLYILDTDTWEWGYVGESGAEVLARNSHSMSILNCDGVNFLVIYGGASPEHGPLGDVVYAQLPDAASIDPKSFYVEWKVFESVAGSATPGAREMHSSSSVMNTLIITGGRDEHGNMLSDVWALKLTKIADVNEYSLDWEKWENAALSSQRCAHVSCFVSTLGSPTEISWKLCIFGGFSSSGVSSEILSFPLDYDESTKSVVPCQDASWQKAAFSNGPKGRFGHALCPLSHEYLISLWRNGKYRPLIERANIGAKIALMDSVRSSSASSSCSDQFRIKLQAGINCGAAFLFGGVDAEEDFADIWLLFL